MKLLPCLQLVILHVSVGAFCHPHNMLAFHRSPITGDASLAMTKTFSAANYLTSSLLEEKIDDDSLIGDHRSSNAPIVLVGFSGAGDEIMRLADTLVDQYYGASPKTTKEEKVSSTEISSVIEIIGRDSEGIFSLRPNDMEKLFKEGAITPQDVIVIDFAHRLISENEGVHAPQLQARLLEALEFLYCQCKCLILYVNVDSESGLMAAIPTLMKDQLERKIIELSDYEICIKDEGLHPKTVMAMQALLRVVADGEHNANNPDDSQANASAAQAIVAEQICAWSGVEFELLRIVAHAKLPPVTIGSEDVSKFMGLHTFFLSLSFDDVTKAEPYISQMCKDVDAMEFRVDLLSNNQDRHHVLHQMQLLRRMCRPYAIRAPVLPCRFHVIEDAIPIVYTIRTAHQAGTYDDDDEGIDRMFQLLHLGLRGATEVLDVESAWNKQQTTELLNSAEHRYPSTMILGSHHVVGQEISTAEAVQLFLNCGLEGRAHAAKVVLSINDKSQSYMAYDASVISSKALEAAGKTVIPNISLILGEVGVDSRVVNPLFTPVTHESLPFMAAPGQLSASELMKRRVESGLIQPKRYAILGHNIAYSVSPQMHGAAFEATRLPHAYVRVDVETVEEFVGGELFTSSDFGGSSVTIPHKQNIIPYVDVMSDAAKEIGSVNTLVVLDPDRNSDKRKIYGDNTDWIGIFNPLRRKLDAASDSSSSSSGVALILGGGGTARAAAYAAKQLGLDIVYYNRTPSKAAELADTFGGEVVTSLSAEEKGGLAQVLSRESRILRVVLSTIPKSAEFELPEWILQQQVKPIVLDVNYKPYHTPLLNQSERFGCEVVRGSEMLWEQGVRQFELWTDRKAPYKVMKDVVLLNCLPENEKR